jgi:hypothetical protein
MSKFLNNSRPEAELLLLCIHSQTNATTSEKIKYLLQQEIDWKYIIHIAEKHRVIPLLYRSLNLIRSPDIPPQILSELRSRFFDNTRNNFIITHELCQLLSLFQENGIRAIPYKGTVLAASVYGKVSLRQVWDLDFLVSESDFATSRELLLAQGYELKENFDREQSFYHPQRGVEVDLHWGLTPFYFPVNIDFESFWKRRKIISLSQTNIESFSAEDMLLILCIQVAKDCWERRQHLEHLAKVCDIAALLATHTQLNWETVIDEARRLGILRILYFGLFLAQDLLDAKLPDNLGELVQNNTVVRSLAEQVCCQLFGEIDGAFAPLTNSLWDWKLRRRQLVFYLRLRERLKDKIQHILEILRTIAQLNKNHVTSPINDN